MKERLDREKDRNNNKEMKERLDREKDRNKSELKIIFSRQNAPFSSGEHNSAANNVE